MVLKRNTYPKMAADVGTTTIRIKSFPAMSIVRYSPVDVAQDEVDRRNDRDDVGHVHILQQPRQYRNVVERGRADLDPVGNEPIGAHDVVTHLPQRILGVYPCGSH